MKKSNASKKPAVKKKINRIIAFFLSILPDGNGLLGRSILSILVSNKSLDTSPPKYNDIEEKIKMTTFGRKERRGGENWQEIVVLCIYTCIEENAIKIPNTISGGIVKIFGILKSFRYGLSSNLVHS